MKKYSVFISSARVQSGQSGHGIPAGANWTNRTSKRDQERLNGLTVVRQTRQDRRREGPDIGHLSHGPSVVYASHLIRMRVTPGHAKPDYVAWFLNSRPGRTQIDATSRQIVQSNSNSQELQSLRVPLPPLDVEQEIVARIRAAREEANRERKAAKALAERTQTEAEEMILGTREVMVL